MVLRQKVRTWKQEGKHEVILYRDETNGKLKSFTLSGMPWTGSVIWETEKIKSNKTALSYALAYMLEQGFKQSKQGRKFFIKSSKDKIIDLLNNIIREHLEAYGPMLEEKRLNELKEIKEFIQKN